MKRQQQTLMGLAAALLLPATLLPQSASADSWGSGPQGGWQAPSEMSWRPSRAWTNWQTPDQEVWHQPDSEVASVDQSLSEEAGLTTPVTEAAGTSVTGGSYLSTSAAAIAAAAANSQSGNMYPIGQCTWGVKELAPWAYTYWGNATDWAANAAAYGFTVGTVPVVGAIAVWTDPYGGYGHVAYVTAVESETSIEVLEANIGGNPNIANYRGFFDPTSTSEGVVSYIYPPAQ